MRDRRVSLKAVENRLTPQDDSQLWEKVLHVLGEEFVARYDAEASPRESWFLRIGVCSHWVRPHQSRWTAAGGFAWAVGYKGASGWSHGLPDFDCSLILSFDGEHWKRVEKFSGKRQVVLRVAVPTRTARHKQAAVHSIWSTSHSFTLYGFRKSGGEWRCVAATDEIRRGRIFDADLRSAAT